MRASARLERRIARSNLSRERFSAPFVFAHRGTTENTPMERLFQALDELDDLAAILRHRWQRLAPQRSLTEAARIEAI
jgi:hypothetical protein